MGHSASKTEFGRRDDICACPFSAPGKGDASNPEYQSPPTSSDPSCYDHTRDAFMISLTGVKEISNATCQLLESNGNGADIFYALYHLDVEYCGLHISQAPGPDPSVDKIINVCNNLGHQGLVDPSWPPTTYQCSVCPLEASQTASTTETTLPTSTPDSIQHTTTPVVVATDGTHASTKTTTSSPASSTSLSNATLSGAPASRLSNQGIAAIAVCSVILVAATTALLLCALRRRRRQQEAYDGGGSRSRRMSRATPDFTIPPVAAYEPLLSPSHADRPPLTPPPPLRDRRLLPSLLRPSSRGGQEPFLVFGPPFETLHNSTSSLYSTSHSVHDGGRAASPTPGGRQQKAAFPSSAVCAPTSTKMEPRLERMHGGPRGAAEPPAALSPEPGSPPRAGLRSPPPVSFTFPLQPSPSSPAPSTKRSAHQQHRRGGGGATPQPPPAASSTASSEYRRSDISPPSSPVRPRRPHDEPLEIPDLVGPSPPARTWPGRASPSPGPPPTGALPSLPPGAALGIGIARTTPSGGGISLRNLRGGGGEEVERDSWGSWEETGAGAGAGRMFGVALAPGPGSAGGHGGFG